MTLSNCPPFQVAPALTFLGWTKEKVSAKIIQDHNVLIHTWNHLFLASGSGARGQRQEEVLLFMDKGVGFGRASEVEEKA